MQAARSDRYKRHDRLPGPSQSNVGVRKINGKIKKNVMS